MLFWRERIIRQDFTAPDFISCFDLPLKAVVYGLSCLHNITSAVGGRLTVVAGPGLASLPSPEDRCVLRLVWACPFPPIAMPCDSGACWKYRIGCPVCLHRLFVRSDLV